VAFNPDARVVLAVDVGATHVRIGICNLAGAILAEKQADIAVAEGPARVLDWVAESGIELVSRLERELRDVAAVGIGLPGPVDHETGRPSNPPIMPGWDGYDVPAHIQRTFRCPVLVDNDVNIMALGERAVNWPDVDDLVFVKVATGIGSGIISDGVLRRGANGAAGDVGHIFVARAAGRQCRCGKTGCLEALAGAPGIARTLREDGLVVDDREQILDLIKAGNLQAGRAIREAGRAIGEMLNMCISVVNPSMIVIGGMLSQVGENLLAGIREEVYANSTPLATKDLSIVTSRSGRQAAIIGAGILAAEHVLAADQIGALVESDSARTAVR